jgi:DNA alkylation repair enzyme
MRDGDRVAELLARIDAEADPTAAEQLARYFQVRAGGYAEGDRFVGVKLSRLRELVKPYVRERLPTAAFSTGLTSPIHEHRLACLVVLAEYANRAKSAGDRDRATEVYETYVDHLDHIDNWDLVDCSAPRWSAATCSTGTGHRSTAGFGPSRCGTAGSPSWPPTG